MESVDIEGSNNKEMKFTIVPSISEKEVKDVRKEEKNRKEDRIIRGR